MKLTVLGMNGPYPAPASACSGYLVTSGSTALVMDLGTGTLSALTSHIAPEALDGLLLSHWHYDHASDLLPLVYRMSDALAMGGRPLSVWAPVDEVSPIRTAIKACPGFILHDIAPGDHFDIGSVSVQAFEARHPVPALMYRLTAEAKTLAYTGDTNLTSGLDPLAMKADFLLADGLFTDETWSDAKPHLSSRHAAELASRSGCKALVVTHLNPSIDEKTLLTQAREAFPAVQLASCGAVWTI